MTFSLALLLSIASCPSFVEFFPDPVDVSDDLGEFIEIRLDSLQKDTLFVQQENKPVLFFTDLKGSRLLLHKDTSMCPLIENLDCRFLNFQALPNSRESYWNLYQGNCKDSASLPSPKVGKSLQRNDYLDAWDYETPTPGEPNRSKELGVKDCLLEFGASNFINNNFEQIVKVSGCDSVKISYESTRLDYSNKKTKGEINFPFQRKISIPSNGNPEHLRVFLPKDDISNNDTLETLLIYKEKPPVQMTEIHFCPEEGKSEWVELYNSLPVEIPFSSFSFCDRGGFSTNSINAYETLLAVKDTLSFREELGFEDVRLSKSSFGSLKNLSDTLCLCFKQDTLQCVSWSNLEREFCPLGFNVEYRKRENTPGVQNHSFKHFSKNKTPFVMEWNKRVVAKNKKEELRVRITGEGNVRLFLFSENGTLLWEKTVDASFAQWIEVPLVRYFPGIYFLKGVLGGYEKTSGFVLRP